MKHALTLATTVIAALALGAAPAAAGDYTVRACNGFDGNSSWSPEVTNKYATAYTDCQGDGLVTRMSGASDGSKAPYGAGARFVFTSPDDTKIIRIQDLINANGMNGWAAGLVDSKPSWIWGGAPWTTWNTYRETDLWMDTRQLFAQVTCGDPNGCPRRYLDGLIAMKNIVVTVRDYVGPTVNITGGTVTIPGWHNGGLDYTFAANDPTGIRQVDVKIDGEPRYGKAGECSDVLARPCTDMASGGGLPEDAFGKDGSHVVTITAFDGSGNAATASQSVLVDHTAPSPPLDLRLAGGAGWRSGNDFALMWRNPPQAAAPIIGAHYVICPAGNAGNDTRGCAEGTAYGPDIHGVANLHVPKPGDWRATVWLEDGARNRDSRQASAVAGLRLDTAAPTLAFSGLSSADPTRVHVDASDDLSGVASAQIEAKRQGESAWRALQTSLDARGFSAVLDDDALPHGTYDLRARAVDGAGNEHTTEGDADGNAATRSLPLRVATRLTVGTPARVMATNSNAKRRYRTVLRVRPQAAFGTTIPLRGRLTTPGANPLAAADIEVWERIALPT
ncbi:MAG: hypothetical protein QOE28_1668, partial [Solirubrobacteraceae bacterium]|nr:hypothetical protein [Solirubrobacteraceae bacterium]